VCELSEIHQIHQKKKTHFHALFCTKFDDLVEKCSPLKVENHQKQASKSCFKIWLLLEEAVLHAYVWVVTDGYGQKENKNNG
jgi:hypothetical protein